MQRVSMDREAAAQLSSQSHPHYNAVYETANKILQQFENFADYTRGEVSGIVASLDERNLECQRSLDLLTGTLMP